MEISSNIIILLFIIGSILFTSLFLISIVEDKPWRLLILLGISSVSFIIGFVLILDVNQISIIAQ